VGSLEVVVLEEALLYTAIGELHTAYSILNTILPFALIAGAILPVHLTIARPLVILVAPFVVVATFPHEDAHAIFLVILVATLVHVAVCGVETLPPLALATLEAIAELPDVDAAIFPLILSLAFGLTVHVGPRKTVAIREKIRSLSMLQTVQPLSFVAISVLPLMDAVACRF